MVGRALTDTTVTYLMDRQFDDMVVWSTIWQQGAHLGCRLQRRNGRSKWPGRMRNAGLAP